MTRYIHAIEFCTSKVPKSSFSKKKRMETFILIFPFSAALNFPRRLMCCYRVCIRPNKVHLSNVLEFKYTTHNNRAYGGNCTSKCMFTNTGTLVKCFNPCFLQVVLMLNEKVNSS